MHKTIVHPSGRQSSLQLRKTHAPYPQEQDLLYVPPKETIEKSQPPKKVKLFAIKLEKFLNNKPVVFQSEKNTARYVQSSSIEQEQRHYFNLLDKKNRIKPSTASTKQPSIIKFVPDERMKNGSAASLYSTMKTPLPEVLSQRSRLYNYSISQEDFLNKKTPVPVFGRSPDLLQINTSFGSGMHHLNTTNSLFATTSGGPIIHSFANAKSPKASKNGAPLFKKRRELNSLVHRQRNLKRTVDFNDLIMVQSSEKNKFRLSVDSFIFA